MRRAQNTTAEKYTYPELFFFFSLLLYNSAGPQWYVGITCLQFQSWDCLPKQDLHGTTLVEWLIFFVLFFFFSFLTRHCLFKLSVESSTALILQFFFNLGGSPLCDQWKGLCWVPTLNEPTLPSPVLSTLNQMKKLAAALALRAKTQLKLSLRKHCSSQSAVWFL